LGWWYVQPQLTGESEANVYRPSARRRMPVFAGTREMLTSVFSGSDGAGSKATSLSVHVAEPGELLVGQHQGQVLGINDHAPGLVQHVEFLAKIRCSCVN